MGGKKKGGKEQSSFSRLTIRAALAWSSFVPTVGGQTRRRGEPLLPTGTNSAKKKGSEDAPISLSRFFRHLVLVCGAAEGEKKEREEAPLLLVHLDPPLVIHTRRERGKKEGTRKGKKKKEGGGLTLSV